MKWAIGVVIHTGADTKLAKNSRTPAAKQSNVEKMTNYLVLLLFVVQLILSGSSAIAGYVWNVSASY